MRQSGIRKLPSKSQNRRGRENQERQEPVYMSGMAIDSRQKPTYNYLKTTRCEGALSYEHQ